MAKGGEILLLSGEMKGAVHLLPIQERANCVQKRMIRVGCWAKADETKSATNAGKTLTTVACARFFRHRTPQGGKPKANIRRWNSCPV